MGRVTRHIHHHYRIVRGFKLWQLTLIALALTAGGIMLLRSNSIEAVRLFNNVKAADASLNDAETKKALRIFQQYVSQHMNTQLDRISLEKTYERDYKAAVGKVTNSGSVNDAKYHDSELKCQAELKRTASFSTYAQCVANAVGQTASGKDPLLAADLPQAYRYEYVFNSPDWSPDSAGLTLLLAAMLWAVILARLLLEIVLSVIVRRRHDG